MGELVKQRVSDEQYNEVLRLLTETGALHECPAHPGNYVKVVVDDPRELAVKVYRAANRRITAGEIVLHNQSRRDYTDLVKDIWEDHAVCEDCQIEKHIDELVETALAQPDTPMDHNEVYEAIWPALSDDIHLYAASDMGGHDRMSDAVCAAVQYVVEHVEGEGVFTTDEARAAALELMKEPPPDEEPEQPNPEVDYPETIRTSPPMEALRQLIERSKRKPD